MTMSTSSSASSRLTNRRSRKSEEHLFKWVDEALLDETRMVEAKHLSPVEEVKEMKVKMELQERMIRKMDEELKAKLEERVKEEIMVAAEPGKKMTDKMPKTSLQKFGIIMLVLGTV
ncbi:unnamed protein product [Microthlaspi erraticum]|uniref:Uncharacterized protein n=1 Tax=Microthlaspi erraticum TaxID=1685480 RepID=A0A6D2HX39_9BRAS|nr:unnamed protein product [Microthlaspi erraticum]